jgi:hypothetical protein
MRIIASYKPNIIPISSKLNNNSMHVVIQCVSRHFDYDQAAQFGTVCKAYHRIWKDDWSHTALCLIPDATKKSLERLRTGVRNNSKTITVCFIDDIDESIKVEIATADGQPLVCTCYDEAMTFYAKFGYTNVLEWLLLHRKESIERFVKAQPCNIQNLHFVVCQSYENRVRDHCIAAILDDTIRLWISSNQIRLYKSFVFSSQSTSLFDIIF